MVREANGQNKLRFSQVFWTLFLVVTLSHDFSKCEKHIAIYEETYIKRRIFFIYFEILYIFLSQLFSAVLFGDYSTLRYSFEVEVAYIYFSYRSIWHPCVMIASFFSSMQLFICFHRPVIFPDVVIFSQCFQVSTFIFFSFPAQQFICRFQRTFLNCSKEQCHFFCSIFSLIPNRYTNQPTSRVQFLCACRWHRKPIANFLPLSVFNKYYKYSSKKFLNL